ncbi:PfkB family carbohydrate kinase [Rhodovulum visakhapatnamense]|uniref:Fructose-1-phosphate kinase PfkB-like protein n=1 Tax=Rhodovulum visakhapatnamense TaxID=364297 RepID=A0A4R8GAI7_9RHOB|nr:PfkB family carbohydrate kinase [Rhodovulum visakhapatnamense]TDX33836.1 fructose-1-phosphate kinase PfkB-like protein [Rhodovulum visakhapatnamense]
MSADLLLLCIGAVLWDVIGRAPRPMAPGDDRPGRISRRPGGVALNVAAALARHGLRPAVLGAVGRDAEGEALIAATAALGIETRWLCRGAQPTDIYMAIEDATGLVAAIADAGGLEAAGAAVLAPLIEGPLGTPDRPFAGTVVLDGNLLPGLLAKIAAHPAFAAADLRVAPASPGKAERIAPFLARPGATLYLNRAEAGLILGRELADAPTAAATLRAAGAARVLVTDGSKAAAFASDDRLVAACPAPVEAAHVTGAGDALMAAHIAAELGGVPAEAALAAALAAATRHVTAEADPCPSR